MQKGASTVDLKKTASSDDDFGKDFLESWKSAKLGNDTVDFDMETVPKNKKGSFKFDELDNFELSGNFDKLPSFKLDMADLDFSGLSKKNEKTQGKSSKEYVTGKEESKEDKFSFDFDFNSFDVVSNSTKDKRPGNCSEKIIAEYSSKPEKNQNSSYNISTNNNIPRGQPSDSAHKTQEPIEKKAAITEDNEKETCVTAAHGEYSHRIYLQKENSDNNQDFCIQSFSGDGSLEADLPDIQRGTAPLNDVQPRLTMKKHESLQPINSSSSMSSSPVDSYNSGCWTKSSKKELLNPGSKLQKQQGHGQSTRISGSLIGSIPIKENVYNSNGPKESVQTLKNIKEKQNSDQNLILPPLRSDYMFGNSIKLSGSASTGLQLRTISKLEDNLPQKSPAFISKPINSIMQPTTKATHASTADESRLQLKTSSSSHQTSVSAKNVAEHSLQKLITDATTVGPKMSSAVNNAPSLNEHVVTKLVSGTRLGSHIFDTKNKGAILDKNNYRTIQVNDNKPNSAIPREAKSVRFLEKRMECPLNATTNSTTIEKRVSLHAPLKRKIDEESVADLQTCPLKCVKESTANKRNSVEASPNTNRKMAAEIKIAETCHNGASDANLMSFTPVPAVGNLVVGVSSCFEDEDNLQKAETITRELDNICNMLRRKCEEAKELQVLSIINNNALLFLYNPMLEENIQELQKFASSLLLKEI